MKFKTLITCFVISFAASALFAQHRSDRYHNYPSDNYIQIKGFIGPLIAISSIEDKLSVDMGVTGGLIIKRNFILGVYGQKLVNLVPRYDLATIGYPSFTEGKVNMIQAGGILGFIHNAGKEFNWGVCSSAGLGIISLQAKDTETSAIEKIYDDRIYLVIPKLFVEMNMTNWFKINISAGYRFIGKVNAIYTNHHNEVIPIFYKSDYTKPEFSVSLLFGFLNIRSGIHDL